MRMYAMNIEKTPEDTRSDEDILALSIQSPDIFSVLIDRYQGAFLRRAQAIIRDPEEAKDIVQETFTKIYLAAPRFTKVSGASFKSWAYKILINAAISRYRTLKRRGATLSLDDEEVSAALGERISVGPEPRELSDYVASVLTRIPKHLARILTLAFIDDLSHAEIAEQEGLSISAVKARVHRAKEAFRTAELLFQKL